MAQRFWFERFEVDSLSDQAGPNRVDANTLGRHLLGQPDGHRVDGALGRGVVDVLVRAPEVRSRRRDIDDCTRFDGQRVAAYLPLKGCIEYGPWR